ncbi:MAG: hypothetical protein JST38_05475 [Bacteroidetes bacterium]|nr:hypothetical protein [Bacteroidota bacterium]
MNKQHIALPEGVTDADVANLKRTHGSVHRIAVKVDGKEYVGLFKKPDLNILSAAASLAGSDPIASAELVYNSCKLRADKGMDEDAEVHVAAMGAVGKLFRQLEAEVGEL